MEKSVKFGGGGLIVWEIISTADSRPLIWIHDNVNAAIYKNNIPQFVVPALGSSPINLGSTG